MNRTDGLGGDDRRSVGSVSPPSLGSHGEADEHNGGKHVSGGSWSLAGPDGLFEKIRSHVPTAQGQGQVFERLIKTFLSEDPLFAQRFSQVWLWSEWPGRAGERDTGIDLVAKERDGGLCAIQCKFYGQDHYIARGDIDTFLVASGRNPFTSRLFVSTTERWSTNAEKVLANQYVPVQRIGVAEFASSPFDWSRFDPAHPDQLSRHAPKSVRPHQDEAITDVRAGFEASDRGKLVMACGTGKTFTALRLAERLVAPGGVVLFCVPSISLLSQGLRAWSADATRPLHCLAVCSDAQVTRGEEDIHVYDLALPATTDPKKIAEHLALATDQSRHEQDALVVVFSTYQSLDRIADAQHLGAPVFDLVIADEAHRTTGTLAAAEGYSGFTMVHDAQRLRARRRLYMTATPRLYTDRAKTKAKESDVLLCSMDDEALYGPEFHYLGFGKAVEQGLLSDYRVVVLMVDEAHANEVAHGALTDSDLDLELQDAARLVGCWRGLSKRGTSDGEFGYDDAPMRRAVSFSTTIAYSKQVRSALPAVTRAILDQGEEGVSCEARHVDGTMGAFVRDQALAWLREDPPEGTCRVLTNARCLSEGVDVPALDAVIFTNPRKSQIDVVQAVGRVMRKAEGKRYGYVILPVPVPAGEDPETVLDSNERYKTVWQVLQALRAHDDRFDAEVNKLDLQKNRSGRIQVVGVGGAGKREADRMDTGRLDLAWQGLEDKVFARIVKRVGTTTYWEEWAGDVARIARAHITRIETAIEKNPPVGDAFDRFLAGLRHTINPAVARDEAIEMLAQHLITTPVFEALFGDSEFTGKNPVSEAMAEVLETLHEEEAIAAERAELADFYRSVHTRAEGIDSPEARQKIVKELYEIFFQRAFPRTADRLGIVYTPVEIVDFIARSVDSVLRQEFDSRLGAKGVHVLDPFTGTGTFIARLLAMLEPADLECSYREHLHANEIVLLAYYIAAINIEQTYHALRGDGAYEPFPGIVLADTFQMGEDDEGQLPSFLRPNSERARRQKALPITVIVGNPPYSTGQGSENDNNKNLAYPVLDHKIRSTYAAWSSAGLKRNLYDSYIRAFRWASDRIGNRGVVAFVTNGAFIDSSSADGFRKALAEGFSSIYCLNLRGNQRTSGETSRREGGKVFGSGSRTPVAITLLVKNPDHGDPAEIHYHDIGDYLTREDKLARLVAFGDVSGVPWEQVTPNAAGDWINLRSDIFETFPPLGDKKAAPGNATVFGTYSLGVVTNRDAWAYNFSRANLLANMKGTIDVYNEERARFHEAALTDTTKATSEVVDTFVDPDPTKISWTRGLKNDLRQDKPAVLDPFKAVPSMYRPFCKEWLYFDRQWNEMVYRLPSLFPTPDHANRVISLNAADNRKTFGAIMTDVVPSLALSDPGQCFPRYCYTDAGGTDSLFAASSERYERHDAISARTLDAYRARFGAEVSADDVFYYVYGVLHSPEYRTRFAADLGKMIPRLPMVDAFSEFVAAGRRLADLHVGYEGVEPWPLDGLPGTGADASDLRVEKMRFAGNARTPDKSAIVVNHHITLSGIPDEAYLYEVNGKSALEWIMDRYQVSTHKDSGMVNDPNRWSDDPHYIVELVARIVRVSIESAVIVAQLPGLGV
ncbi:MAG: DEAD/DEAH box helicase [Acidimicrobiales bacterium]